MEVDVGNGKQKLGSGLSHRTETKRYSYIRPGTVVGTNVRTINAKFGHVGNVITDNFPSHLDDDANNVLKLSS